MSDIIPIFIDREVKVEESSSNRYNHPTYTGTSEINIPVECNDNWLAKKPFEPIEEKVTFIQKIRNSLRWWF